MGLLSYFWVFLGFIGGFALIPLFVWILASLAFGVVSYLTLASMPLVPPYLAPFLFPLYLTTVDIILSFGPWGIWNLQSISLSQWKFAIPLAGVFGVHGYTFTVAVIAGWIAQAITDRISFKASIPTIGWIIFAVLLAGLNQITVGRSGKTIRVGTVSHPGAETNTLERSIEAYASEIKHLAERGAQVVVIPEGSFWVRGEEKGVFMTAMEQIARQFGVVLVAGFIDEEENFNKAGVFAPDGNVAFYSKRYPVFLAEPVKRGTGPPLVVDTPVGKLGVIICHDDVYPRFVRRAKLLGAELLAIPSLDWYQVHRQHRGISLYASLLFALPVIRATGQGISQVVSAEGEVLGEGNDFEEKPARTLVDLPLSTGATLYTFLGDIFSYALLFGAFLLLLWWVRCTLFS
ncbi:MAG: nitrilase-related carbon-nitrogen hydrolase [bacterium]